MNDVIQAAAELQSVCAAEGWRFCFIGGVALLRWGQPRQTADADMTLLADFGKEEPVVRALLARFAPRISDAADFAIAHRVLLLRAANGVGLDVALGALPFEQAAVARATDFEYPPGVSLRTCSAEDLLIMKAFAGRTQDWADVERILSRQGKQLDWSYVRAQLAPLAALKGEADLVAELEARRPQA